MSVLSGVLKDEIERLTDMEQVYLDKLNSFPQGSIHLRVIKKNGYGYWKYKDGDSFVQKCLGIYNSDKVQNMISQIDKRKNFELQLKQIKIEKKKIQKLLDKMS